MLFLGLKAFHGFPKSWKHATRPFTLSLLSDSSLIYYHPSRRPQHSHHSSSFIHLPLPTPKMLPLPQSNHSPFSLINSYSSFWFHIQHCFPGDVFPTQPPSLRLTHIPLLRDLTLYLFLTALRIVFLWICISNQRTWTGSIFLAVVSPAPGVGPGLLWTFSVHSYNVEWMKSASLFLSVCVESVREWVIWASSGNLPYKQNFSSKLLWVF